MSRLIRVHPEGGVITSPVPPRAAISAINRSLACTFAGTLTGSSLLTAPVLPVAVPRRLIREGVGAAVGVAVGAGVGVAVGDSEGVGDGAVVGAGVTMIVGVGTTVEV